MKDMRPSRNPLTALTQADARAITRRDALKTFGSAAGLVAACSLFGASALSFVGCSPTEASSASSASSSASSSSSAASSSSSSAAVVATDINTSGKSLVVYFSGSGNTERVANDIAATIGADTFAIEPVDPYTSEDLNWTTTGSRVNVEHDDESARDIELVQVTPNDFASYENVFIGYPIWWGIAAWPIDGFVSGNDFSGKTVIPFCTSTSSGLGQSADLLEDIAEGGNWVEGHRFSSSATPQEVASWLESLGFAS